MFSEHDVELAQEIARRVAIALENSRLYEEVRKSSEQKDDFLAMLAHELRNPLAAIELANQLSEMSDGQEIAMAREITARQVKNLSHLIDDLLDLSRITRDMIQLKRELVDICTIVQSAAATVQPLIAERQHVLAVDCPDEVITVDADPVRIEQVLVNLLSNAAKYTPHGGRIAVSVSRDGADVVVRVRDNGVGISPDMLPRVFELFTQLDRTLDRSQGGLGIGLTLVRRLVELHGGTVSARSDGLGQGSEFTVRFSAHHSTAASNIRYENLEPVIRPGLKVLVVDDNRDTARAQSLLLKARGCNVTVGHDGLSALEKAREFQPDVFVLDIGLPGIDGYELVGRLKASGFENCTFIAVSGYGQPDDRARSQRAGFHYHLVKPVVGEELYSLLARVSADEPAD
jgi:CheY-like chemotaxis protein